MKAVERYRHEDGRTVDVCEEKGGAFTLWQIFPVRDQLESLENLEEAQEKLGELGFELDDQGFAPPCPRCRKVCTMRVDSGLYFCDDCQNAY